LCAGARVRRAYCLSRTRRSPFSAIPGDDPYPRRRKRALERILLVNGSALAGGVKSFLDRAVHAASAALAKRPLWALAALGVYSVIVLGAGLVLQQKHVPHAAIDKVKAIVSAIAPAPPASVQTVAWRDLETSKHVLQIAEFQVEEKAFNGGALAEVGDNLVISSPMGNLSYLDRDYRLHALTPSVPINIEGLRKAPVYSDPLFNVTMVRTHDLLAVKTGETTYDLYASFNRYVDKCFDFVIARLPLAVKGGRIDVAGPWRDVWTAKPCVPFKDRGQRFIGEMSGGRMIMLDKNTLFTALGDYEIDGFYDSRAIAMDPAWDMGKAIEIDLRTGAGRQIARGFRNPEGLFVDAQGRRWETEHGPQGGDELNLLEKGKNYGWPIVTYGMVYGSPPQNWPVNPHPGRHDGYARPRFAFVPSIAISNLVAPDTREFPLWADSLVVGSLKDMTLYILRLEGDEVVYVEPIPLPWNRLRDIVSLHDGRLAILADGGTLILIRNKDRHRGEAQSFTASGPAAFVKLYPGEHPSANVDPVKTGRLMFEGSCASCHRLDGRAGVGPPLNGIVGRKIASAPGYEYSSALAGLNGAWTEEEIIKFANQPDAYAPGTKMPVTGLAVDDLRIILDYLKTTRTVKVSSATPTSAK
jgi:cytochrome c2